MLKEPEATLIDDNELNVLLIDDKELNQLARLSNIWQLIDLTKWNILEWVDNEKVNNPDILNVSKMVIKQIENVLWEDPEKLRDSSIQQIAIRIWNQLLKNKSIKNINEIAIWNFVKRIAHQVSNLHLRYERFNNHLEKSALRTKNTIDSLTQLLNREVINQYIQWIIDKKINKEDNESYWVILIDIDYFKKINDSFWHIIWDIVLEEISKIFTKNFRETDKVWRWWWEEFIIVMKWWDSNKYWEKLENIREYIENNLIKNVNNRIKEEWVYDEIDLEKITVSIGFTWLSENDDIASATDRADKALYVSKNSWRNSVNSIIWFSKK